MSNKATPLDAGSIPDSVQIAQPPAEPAGSPLFCLDFLHHFNFQIALCNQVFTPSEAAVTEAREIIAAMKKASAEGQGATVYKGRLVDIASIRQAQVIVDTAEMIGA